MMKETIQYTPDIERNIVDVNVKEITSSLKPLGNPDAGISVDKKLADGSLTEQELTTAHEVISNPECFVPVTERDCGCIDGRVAHRVIYYDADGQLTEREKDATTITHHNRAKVAGGGYCTVMMAKIGAFGAGESFDEDLRTVGVDLTDADIVCGAHTGDHAQEGTSDCGALDKKMSIMERAVANQDTLCANLEAAMNLAGLQYDDDAARRVLANWKATYENSDYARSDNPARHMDVIRGEIIPYAQEKVGNDDRHPVSVIKKLKGDHNEVGVALNLVPETTLSQRIYAKQMREKLDVAKDQPIPDMFCVDLWRVVELASVYENTPEYSDVLHGALAYQLATAAQLTDGTLRVYAVTQ